MDTVDCHPHREYSGSPFDSNPTVSDGNASSSQSDTVSAKTSDNTGTLCGNARSHFGDSIMHKDIGEASNGLELEEVDTESLIDYYLDTHVSSRAKSNESSFQHLEVEVDPRSLSQRSQPKPHSTYFMISSVALERQRTIVGEDHPGLLALRKESRQLRCGQPCRGCGCLSIDNIRDPEFCSDLTMCLGVICCPFSTFH